MQVKPMPEVGAVFGQWTVIDPERVIRVVNGRGRSCCLCRCSCGTERMVDASSLRTGVSKSCGCTRMGNFMTARAIAAPDWGDYTDKERKSVFEITQTTAIERELYPLPPAATGDYEV